jgi:2-(1,2-epoxy-1,2-dihydrophenyl)acetyl-CoA isomerase
MTGRVAFETVRRGAADFAILTLDRPHRTNSLTPGLLAQLNDALDEAGRAEISGLVLRAEGKFFSSGGDVAGFAALSGAGLTEYAEEIVGQLQKAVLALCALPVPVMTRLQGGVTGGASGLVFAADLVAMAEDAFIQPYYCEVGFAPDGGWAALLPERIGAARAMSIQALNERILAPEALRLGLADKICAADGLDAVIEAWLETLAPKKLQTLRATKRLIRGEADLERLRKRLEAERRAFVELIARPETAEGMARFLA